jgi:hypothetical protein
LLVSCLSTPTLCGDFTVLAWWQHKIETLNMITLWNPPISVVCTEHIQVQELITSGYILSCFIWLQKIVEDKATVISYTTLSVKEQRGYSPCNATSSNYEKWSIKLSLRLSEYTRVIEYLKTSTPKFSSITGTVSIRDGNMVSNTKYVKQQWEFKNMIYSCCGVTG